MTWFEIALFLFSGVTDNTAQKIIISTRTDGLVFCLTHKVEFVFLS